MTESGACTGRMEEDEGQQAWFELDDHKMFVIHFLQFHAGLRCLLCSADFFSPNAIPRENSLKLNVGQICCISNNTFSHTKRVCFSVTGVF